MREPKKELYNDIWFYYKKWLNNSGTDEEWEQIIKDGNEILQKYKNDSFSRSLVGAVQIEIGRKDE
jgi:hypothetical protein